MIALLILGLLVGMCGMSALFVGARRRESPYMIGGILTIIAGVALMEAGTA